MAAGFGYLFLVELSCWTHWLGGVGVLIAIVGSPIFITACPIIYWIAEHEFPLWAVIAWAAMFTGGLLFNLSRETESDEL